MTLYRCYSCGKGFMGRSTYEGGASLCDKCLSFLEQLKQTPLRTLADASRAGADLRSSNEYESYQGEQRRLRKMHVRETSVLHWMNGYAVIDQGSLEETRSRESKRLKKGP
jgi:hypothetical protein